MMEMDEMGQTKLMPNIIEATTLEEANKVDLEVYRFERFSESRRCYIFVKRARA